MSKSTAAAVSTKYSGAGYDRSVDNTEDRGSLNITLIPSCVGPTGHGRGPPGQTCKGPEHVIDSNLPRPQTWPNM